MLHCLDFYHYSILAFRNCIPFLMAKGLEMCTSSYKSAWHYRSASGAYISFLFVLQVLGLMQ